MRPRQVKLAVRTLILASLLLAGDGIAKVQLERSKNYLSVMEPKAATADCHYAVTSYLLLRVRLDDDQKRAVETGKRRAEELILQRWADQHLKPFFFVNFSRSRNDLYILDKIRWNEPVGKRVADAVKLLDDPISVSPNLQACYQFRWVEGLKDSDFARFAAKITNLSEARWVEDRRSSIARQLSAKLNSRHRQTMRQIEAAERAYQAATPDKKVSIAMQLYEFLGGAGGQYEGKLLTELETKRQQYGNLVVAATVSRFRGLNLTSGAELQREIEALANSRRQWQRDPLLAALEKERAAELDKLALELDARTSELWAKEISEAALNRRFDEGYRIFKQRLSGVDKLAEENREPAAKALWLAYNKMLPEAATHWQQLAAREIEQGGRVGLSYLLGGELARISAAHAELGVPLTPNAESALKTAAELREQYGKLCDLRNQRKIILAVPGGAWKTAAEAMAKRLQPSLDDAKWVTGVAVEIASEPDYLLDRDCLVSIDEGQLLVRADNEERELGKATPANLGPAADGAIAGLAGRYPLVLMEKAESASSLGAILHFWGLAVRAIEQVDLKQHPDEELRIQLLDVPELANESVRVILADWLDSHGG